MKLKYIYIIAICLSLSACNTPTLITTSTGSINTGITTSELTGSQVEQNPTDPQEIIPFGSNTGLKQTETGEILSSPLYTAIDGCNRESRKQSFGTHNIYILAMNCQLEDGYYTVNPSQNGKWTEDQYINKKREPQSQVMQVFERKNINNFDDLNLSGFDKIKCELHMVNSDNKHEERELLTKGDYTQDAEYQLQGDNSFLPCGEYGYSQVGRRRFTVFKSNPELVFFSNISYEYPLFDPNTIVIK